MQLAIVAGSVVATQKVLELQGRALKVLLVCDDQRKRSGETLVAVDAVGAREGDLVMWVGKREASIAFDDAPLVNMFPIDAAITGIVDDIS